MNTLSSTPEATPDMLAAFFTETRDDVMSRWAAQVISEIPVSTGLDSPVLIDTLPILYDDIAEAVSPGVVRPFATSKSNLARMHGQERARMTNYGPGDVVHELQLFRDVIFYELKAQFINLGVHECEIIGKSIDIATREAIAGYYLVVAKLNETFIASLSHDLRNPLQVANSIAQLMQMKWSDPDLISMAKRVCKKRFCRISERGGPVGYSVALANGVACRVNCGAESRTNRHAQLQRDALSDRCDPGLHPLVCGLPAELPARAGPSRH